SVPSAVAPGKRPRSSMVPSILLTRDGRFAGAIGSAGGNAILAYVAHSLVASVDWNMSMADALAAPNLVARGPNFQGETTKFSPAILDGLRQRGIDLKPGQGEDSGLTGVLIRDGRIDGAGRPPREAALRHRGTDWSPGRAEDSGLTGLLIRDGRIDGPADPRREGVILTLPR